MKELSSEIRLVYQVYRTSPPRTTPTAGTTCPKARSSLSTSGACSPSPAHPHTVPLNSFLQAHPAQPRHVQRSAALQAGTLPGRRARRGPALRGVRLREAHLPWCVPLPFLSATLSMTLTGTCRPKRRRIVRLHVLRDDARGVQHIQGCGERRGGHAQDSVHHGHDQVRIPVYKREREEG